MDIQGIAAAGGYTPEYLWAVRRGAIKFSPKVREVLDHIRDSRGGVAQKIRSENSEPETFGDRLLRWRERRGYTRDAAAKLLGVGSVMYGEIEDGRDPSPAVRRKFDEIQFDGGRVAETALSEKYERLREEKRDGQGLSNRPAGDGRANIIRKVPVIGWAKAGQAQDFEDIVDWENPISTEINDAKAFAIRVVGDSMNPLIADGDLVVVTPSEPARHEQYVVARLISAGLILKQLRKLEGGVFEFRSLNPFYPPMIARAADIAWIYPVAQLIKKL